MGLLDGDDIANNNLRKYKCCCARNRGCKLVRLREELTLGSGLVVSWATANKLSSVQVGLGWGSFDKGLMTNGKSMCKVDDNDPELETVTRDNALCVEQQKSVGLHHE